MTAPPHTSVGMLVLGIVTVIAVVDSWRYSVVSRAPMRGFG